MENRLNSYRTCPKCGSVFDLTEFGTSDIPNTKKTILYINHLEWELKVEQMLKMSETIKSYLKTKTGIESLSQNGILGNQLDITGAEDVEIITRDDKKVIWVNVEGVCKLRICRIKKLRIGKR